MTSPARQRMDPSSTRRRRQRQQSAVQPKAPASAEIIVIDDDDDDLPSSTRQDAVNSAAQHTLEGFFSSTVRRKRRAATTILRPKRSAAKVSKTARNSSTSHASKNQDISIDDDSDSRHDPTLMVLPARPLHTATCTNVALRRDHNLKSRVHTFSSSSEIGDVGDAALIPKTTNIKKLKRKSTNGIDDKTASSTLGLAKPASTTILHSEPLLKDHCWVCHAALRHPNQPKGELRYYSLHWHPHLPFIATCCLCAQATSAIDPDETCVGCGLDDDADADNDVSSSSNNCLYLCDNEDCELAFCRRCIMKAVQPLTEDFATDLDNPLKSWKCLGCEPPWALKRLQNEQQEVQESLSNIPTDKEEIQEKIKQLLEELEDLETEKERFDEEEDKRNWDQLRAEIRSDFKRKDPVGEPSALVEEEIDVSGRVEEEIEGFIQSLDYHDARLMDTISCLRDQLDSLGFDTQEYYRDRHQLADQVTTNSKVEPDWKLQVDRLLNERDQAALDCAESTSSDEGEGKRRGHGDEGVDDVIELAGLSDNEATSMPTRVLNRRQWRNSRRTASSKEMREAWAEENKERTSPKIAARAPQIITDKQDCTLLQKASLFVGSRDLQEETQARRVQRRRHQQKRQSRSIEAHKNTSASQLSSKAPASSLQPSQISTGQNAANSPASGDFKSQPAVEASPVEADQDIRPQRGGKVSCAFEKSDLIVLDPNGIMQSKHITIAQPLAQQLKPHQKDAVQFIFRNVFADLCCLPAEKNVESGSNKSVAHGCILAHNMGLGKSFSTIASIHAMMYHPNISVPDSKSELPSVLLVVPVNTVSNWVNEWSIWTDKLDCCPVVYNLSEVAGKASRTSLLKRWSERGGVMIMSKELFNSLTPTDGKCLSDSAVENSKYLQDPGPDVLVIDEAHMVVQTSGGAIFNSLNKIRSTRRILLTGSPFQNSLLEYFRMISFIQPGLLGMSESKFDEAFVKPIMKGSASDASPAQQAKADMLLVEIREKIAPFIDRKEAALLLNDLPDLQQVVLKVRSTQVQNLLHSAYKKHQKTFLGNARNSFMARLHALNPVQNHPGALLKKSRFKRSFVKDSAKKPEASPGDTLGAESAGAKDNEHPSAETKSPDQVIEAQESDDEADEADADEGFVDSSGPKEWWAETVQKVGLDTFTAITSSNKVVILLHILVLASKTDEKVVLFCKCLKTLDFLEDVLALEDWQNRAPTLKAAFPSTKIGGWKIGRDFLRMDGSDTGADRGSKVQVFNEDMGLHKLFLISTHAGGVGINLCSASRVVLFDPGFNPTKSDQAVFRCYRYGQSKSVFVYRLLTSGTMEDKIHARAVNKSSLANTLVDGKNLDRLFTDQEVANINEDIAEWVQCDHCETWRMLPPHTDPAKLPDKWCCKMMNLLDKRIDWHCKVPEKDQLWYETEHYSRPNEPHVAGGTPMKIDTTSAANLSQQEIARIASRDRFLQPLLDIRVGTKNPRPMIEHHSIHDLLVKDSRDNSQSQEPEDYGFSVAI